MIVVGAIVVGFVVLCVTGWLVSNRWNGARESDQALRDGRRYAQASHDIATARTSGWRTPPGRREG